MRSGNRSCGALGKISLFDSFPRPSFVMAFIVTGLRIQKQGLVDGGTVTPTTPLESRWASEAQFGDCPP